MILKSQILDSTKLVHTRTVGGSHWGDLVLEMEVIVSTNPSLNQQLQIACEAVLLLNLFALLWYLVDKLDFIIRNPLNCLINYTRLTLKH